jgi:hypothetical protein
MLGHGEPFPVIPALSGWMENQAGWLTSEKHGKDYVTMDNKLIYLD